MNSENASESVIKCKPKGRKYLEGHELKYRKK
jgi:hypothetical protein